MYSYSTETSLTKLRKILHQAVLLKHINKFFKYIIYTVRVGTLYRLDDRLRTDVVALWLTDKVMMLWGRG